MHLILMLCAAGLVGYVIYQLLSGGAGAARITAHPAATPRRRGEHPLAFISHGKIFYRAPGQQEIREVQSAYVQTVADRMERSRERNSWKQGTSFQFMRGGGEAEAPPNIQASSLQFATADRILYFLRDEGFGGLFEQSLAEGQEKRLLHKQNMSLENMAINAEGNQLLCSARLRNGTANIAMVDVDGRDYRELTGGDTFDTAPAWVPGKDAVVFQSSGIARAQQGGVLAYGPATLQMLDTKTGSLSTVLEDPQWEFLAPRVGGNGYLYFIRRPYEAQYGTRNALLDALLMPFRLLRAVFHYLNFFSLMYSRQPLTGAGGPMLQGDLKDIVVKGKRMDAESALRRGVRVAGVPSLVPANWQLVCRSPNAEEYVLASHVASYDIAADGAVLFSNGYGVFALDGGSAPEVLLRDKLVAEVIVGQGAAG